MKANDWLISATQRLESARISTGRLDSLVLLEDALQKDRSWLLANPDFIIEADVIQNLDKLIKRRSSHEPLAYIRGRSEFYGREFIVSPATLQPRPETETMIELLKGLELTEAVSIVDVGTGSGAIAITAKLELPHAKVSATEINAKALNIAKQNSKFFRTNISFYLGNVLAPLNGTADVILANLPYVPDGFTVNPAAMQEPRVAIFGGADGLELYRDMFEQIKLNKQKPKFVLTEALPYQHGNLTTIASSAGYSQSKAEDFIQMFVLD